MGRGRGLRSPSPPQVGSDRARARALLLEMVERNYTQAPNPVSCQTGRGRGLRSPSPSCPGSRARARALPLPFASNAPSLEKPGVEPLALANFLKPLASPQYYSQCLCPQGNFPDCHIQLSNEPTLHNPQEPHHPIPTSSH